MKILNKLKFSGLFVMCADITWSEMYPWLNLYIELEKVEYIYTYICMKWMLSEIIFDKVTLFCP